MQLYTSPHLSTPTSRPDLQSHDAPDLSEAKSGVIDLHHPTRYLSNLSAFSPEISSPST